MEFLVGILIGFIGCYVLLMFTTVKTLKTAVAEELAAKDALKEEIYQLKASTSQSEQMQVLFENLASKIFKQNTEDFSKLNQKEMEALLKPFKENLFEFGQKMEHVKTQNTVLETQIKTLKESSETLSKDAQNLAEALRGNAKIRGDWGEDMLKRILEASGLEKGVHYTLQDSFATEDGRLQTDCIVKMAEDRNIVIDSKVSLVPLQNFYKAADDDEQKNCLKELERSIRGHIDTLDKKAYQDIESIGAPDYVLMFMPVESAFTLMVSEFDQLIDYAWNKRVLLVSPSTLMVALKTIALFWQEEKRNKNINEIARVGAGLYDKFYGVLENFEGISTGINTIQKNYDGAMSKIKGHGGIASQVEKLKVLGAKTKKQISKEEYIEVE